MAGLAGVYYLPAYLVYVLYQAIDGRVRVRVRVRGRKESQGQGGQSPLLYPTYYYDQPTLTSILPAQKGDCHLSIPAKPEAAEQEKSVCQSVSRGLVWPGPAWSGRMDKNSSVMLDSTILLPYLRSNTIRSHQLIMYLDKHIHNIHLLK